MTAFIIIFVQVFLDLIPRLGRKLPFWLAIGGILVSVSTAHNLYLAIYVAIIFLFLPIIYLPLHAFLSAIRYWKNEGLILLCDVTRRQFYKNGHVQEIWTRHIKNASTTKSADVLDIPIFWDIPLEQIYPVAIHISKKTSKGRYHTESQIYEISKNRDEYTERLYEGRKFYGCIIPIPLGLEFGESLFLKLMYRHIINAPTDDQIIRSFPRLLKLIWEGEANDGLRFDPENSYIEARYPDPTSASRRKETKRAMQYLKFEEANTRMIFDLPRPKPGYHYRIVFTLEEMLTVQITDKRNK